MLFGDIFGNKKTLDILRHDIKNEKLAHAYLLSGPPYIGKYKILKEFASLLQCEHHDFCGHCNNCVLSIKNTHPDITVIEDLPIEKSEQELHRTNVFLEPRKTNTITIKDIKTIQERLYHTTDSPYSIILIGDIERMNKEAANSLLKVIEEPPSKKLLFLFSTKDISRVRPTIISRCKRLDLHAPTEEETKDFLDKQDFKIHNVDELLKFIPNSPGYLFTIAKSPETLEAIRERVTYLEEVLEDKDLYRVFKYAGDMKTSQEALQIIEHLETYFYWLSKHTSKSLEKISFIEKALEVITKTKKYLGANVSSKLAMEQCMLQIHPLIHQLL